MSGNSHQRRTFRRALEVLLEKRMVDAKPSQDKWARIYFWIGLFVALLALGLPLIGVAINIWLGGALLAGAFIAIVRAFWIWESPWKLHVLLRLATVVIAGTVYFFLVGNQMWHEYRKEHQAEAAKKEAPPQPETRPVESPKPPKPSIVPIKNPLEIVAFKSDARISIANKGPLPIHVLSLFIQYDDGTMSAGLALDIDPGKIAEEKIQVTDSFPHNGTRPKLADTWDGHVKRVKELYGACGMKWMFFSPSDEGFHQIKDHYAKQNESLGYKDILGVLSYRVQGFNRTEKQSVPLIETITINDDACPKLLRPHPES